MLSKLVIVGCFGPDSQIIYVGIYSDAGGQHRGFDNGQNLDMQRHLWGDNSPESNLISVRHRNSNLHPS